MRTKRPEVPDRSPPQKRGFRFTATYEIYQVRCCRVSLAHENAAFHRFEVAGPLTGFFVGALERSGISHTAGIRDDLKHFADELGGNPSADAVGYHVALLFDAPPEVSVPKFFNERDEEFTSPHSLRFESRAGTDRNTECLAICDGQL